MLSTPREGLSEMTVPKEGTRPGGRSVVILGGLRTPFATVGTSLMAVEPAELARRVIEELLLRRGIALERVDEVILGSLLSEPGESSVARSSALRAGLPSRVPAITVQRGSASGLQAVSAAAERIQRGVASLVIAGGVDSRSARPIFLQADTRCKLAALARADSVLGKILAAVRLRPEDFRAGRLPDAVDYDAPVGLHRLDSAERLAREFDIARAEQDEYALDSHHRALKAAVEGFFAEEIVEVHAPPDFRAVLEDNGPRKGQCLEALSRLEPCSIGRHGTVTRGNSCRATDGAAVLLLASQEMADELEMEPLGFVAGWGDAGGDPWRQGLGSVYAAARVLDDCGLRLDALDRLEIHESSAAEVLACRKAMASGEFARRELGRTEAMGDIDPERLNVHGGAIAMGHPVGASTVRQALTLLLDLRRNHLHRGLVASSAGGGQGAAIVLEIRE